MVREGWRGFVGGRVCREDDGDEFRLDRSSEREEMAETRLKRGETGVGGARRLLRMRRVLPRRSMI